MLFVLQGAAGEFFPAKSSTYSNSGNPFSISCISRLPFFTSERI